MKITNEWLKKHEACIDGYKWSQTQKNRELIPFIDALVKSDHWEWANWVIVRVMTYDQHVAYAVFAAEQVINIYEDKYPEDKRPRLAIEAAKKCVGLKGAGWDAAGAARDAAGAAARAAAWAAGDAARAAQALTIRQYIGEEEK